MLKHTPEESPDKVILPQVIAIVREFLGKVNAESGKTENRFNLIQLDQQLVFKQGEEVVSVSFTQNYIVPVLILLNRTFASVKRVVRLFIGAHSANATVYYKRTFSITRCYLPSR